MINPLSSAGNTLNANLVTPSSNNPSNTSNTDTPSFNSALNKATGQSNGNAASIANAAQGGQVQGHHHHHGGGGGGSESQETNWFATQQQSQTNSTTSSSSAASSILDTLA